MSVASSEIIPISSSSFQCSAPIFSGRMPLPPGVNGSYKNVHVRRRDGREYDRLGGTEALKQFKKDAEHELLLARCDLPVIEAIRASYEHKEYVPLVVTIRFFFAEMWRKDIDGPIKAVMDAAFDFMEIKDVLVVRLRDITKDVDRADPHAEIDIACVLSSSVAQK